MQKPLDVSSTGRESTRTGSGGGGILERQIFTLATQNIQKQFHLLIDRKIAENAFFLHKLV
jgi:hypothetical protein